MFNMQDPIIAENKTTHHPILNRNLIVRNSFTPFIVKLSNKPHLAPKPLNIKTEWAELPNNSYSIAFSIPPLLNKLAHLSYFSLYSLIPAPEVFFRKFACIFTQSIPKFIIRK